MFCWFPQLAHVCRSLVAGRKSGRPNLSLILASFFLVFLTSRLSWSLTRRSAGELSGPWSAEALATGTGPRSLASPLIAGSWLARRGSGRWSAGELLDPGIISLVP